MDRSPPAIAAVAAPLLSGWWNDAIWRKTWGDQRVLVVSLIALWAVFPWLFIWLSAQIEMTAFQGLLSFIPKDWQKLSGVPFAEVATPAGRVALAFVDPVVVLAATVFAITRGSDAVSGQVERGTLEMILAQPVTRTAFYVTQALATVAAAGLLCAVLLAGVWSAVALGPWAGEVEPSRFVPAVANVFGLIVCIAGLTTCVSAADSYRSRTIGILCGGYVLSLLAKLVGRFVGRFEWVGWLSIFSAYEPQRLVGADGSGWGLVARYDGLLLGIGVVAYVIGGLIFVRRDLPAPL